MSLLYFMAPWDQEVTKESICMMPVDPIRCTRTTTHNTSHMERATAAERNSGVPNEKPRRKLNKKQKKRQNEKQKKRQNETLKQKLNKKRKTRQNNRKWKES